jgi:hypothetical protein
MLDRLVSLLLEVLFYTTGYSVLRLFGRSEPGDIASWFTGLALWMLAGLAIVVLASF